jgi:GTP cyclohydrolase I
MKIKHLTHNDVLAHALQLATILKQHGYEGRKAFPVPRGGIPALYVLANFINLTIVDTPEEADFMIDDLIDSGATRDWYREQFGKAVYALFVKTEHESWLVFPWEQDTLGSADDIPRRLLQYIGEDPTRGGLAETPKRFLKAWSQYTSGYKVNPADILKTFEDGAEKTNELVIVKGIPIYSTCEHHLAPIFGTAAIGYIPNGRIVGLSKLSRLADVFARRLQVQERMTTQIADTLVEHLSPLGVGVVLECRHMCMEARGIQRQGTTTITSAMRGILKDDHNARAEFLKFIDK